MTGWDTVLLFGALRPYSLRVLFPYIPVALTLLVTLCYHNTLKRRFGDAKGMWLYFSLFFLILVVVPVVIIFALEPQPLQVLADLGVGWGNYKIGAVLVLAWLPISILVSHFTSKNPEMKEYYPFSKKICRSDGSFVLYEIGYILLYYTAWEFLYRGLLFFPLLSSVGYLPAMAITAALSTLHHIGHPKSEILGALLGGFIFSFVALLTRSLLYPIALHAMVGVGVDIFVYARNYRVRSVR